jgi:gamma-glutamyltranspeptidase/glutathione hydrolase
MRRLFLVIILAVAAITAPAHATEGSRFHPAVTSELGVVATESPAASEVGRMVLERGGNAADAAVATVFAINVARPQSCGIGGGGFATYRRADGHVDSLDFRETAPAAFRSDTLVPDGLHKKFTGHLTVGVPGTLAGMDALLKRYGTWSLRKTLLPSIPMAAGGVDVLPSLHDSMVQNADRLRIFPASAALYLKDGQPYPAGARLRNPDLARTFALIARKGPDAFYRGPIAKAIIKDMATAANIPGDDAKVVYDDFGRYEARWRDPLVGSYRGNAIVSVPPPSSGGTTLLEELNILSGYDMTSFGQSSADSLHLIAESQKLAWADRNAYVADPGFVEQPTAGLISPRYADQRRALIDVAKAQTYTAGDPKSVPARASAKQSPGDLNLQGSTTHVSIVDRAGNAIALTCTIEQEFGSAVVAPGTGFLLNNELTDFGDPGTANEPAPGKRPRSSMAPTIVVRDGVPVFVVGAAGGARIIGGVADSIIAFTDYGNDVAHAVDAERIDDQTGKELVVEETRLAPGVLDDLVGRGHKVTRKGEYDIRPRVQAAGVDPGSGLRSATSDSRTDWAALAQRR